MPDHSSRVLCTLALFAAALVLAGPATAGQLAPDLEERLQQAAPDERVPAVVLMAEFPEIGDRLAALLHDAPEYVIGDLISPFKAALSLDYRAFEAKLLGAIHVRFGLRAELPDALTKQIKRADKIAAYYEATGLAGFSPPEARRFFGQPKGLNPELVKRLTQLNPLPAAKGEARFLKRYHELAR